MKALITGSNGLLGSAIKNKIGNDHFFHSRNDADLTDLQQTDKLFDTALSLNCDTVIHCAARVGGVQANMNNNKKFFIENILIDKNVLINSFKNNFKNVITILSTCIFPEKANYPLTINQIDNGPPHESNYGYSYAKRLLYYENRIYRNASGNNWISIVPTNLFGPHDQYNLEGSHIIPALIRKAYEHVTFDKPFVVWGDGTPLRQFVFSEDMAEIILWSIDNWNNSEMPLVAIDEKEYSIKETAIIIAKLFNIPEKNIIFDTSKPQGIYRKPAKSDIPNWKFTPFEEAMGKTIIWFKENYNNNIRK